MPRGHHILIVGEPGSGKSTLFRALAGLRLRGSGTIRLPSRETVMFMPQRPYLPLGSLRAAVSYPSEPARFDDAAVRSALERVDLGHLVASLDRDERWDKELSLDEQQRLAFARVLRHAPRWVLLDDGTGALEDEHRQLVRSILARALRHRGIDIGRAPGTTAFAPASCAWRGSRVARVCTRVGGRAWWCRRPSSCEPWPAYWLRNSRPRTSSTASAIHTVGWRTLVQQEGRGSRRTRTNPVVVTAPASCRSPVLQFATGER